MNHPDLRPLARAAADNDAIAEERGVVAALADINVDADDARYVAEQRALRAVLLESGRMNELGATRLTGVRLTRAEQMRLTFLASVYMDGIAIGVRAAVREGVGSA